MMKKIIFLIIVLIIFVFSASFFIEKRSEWVLIRYIEMQNSFLSLIDRDDVSSENMIETEYDGIFLASVNIYASDDKAEILSNDECVEYDISCATFDLAIVSHTSVEVMNGSIIDESKWEDVRDKLERAAVFYNSNSEIHPIKLELATLLYNFSNCRFSPDDSCRSELLFKLREEGFFVPSLTNTDYFFYELRSPEIADAYLRALVRIFDEVNSPIYGAYLKYRIEV